MNLLENLNQPQIEAVTHVDGPLLVLAGAGSGKTRVITRRVAYLIEQGVAPWNVLAITFTNKAAEEMRQRVAALNTPAGATVCTFHALCARVLREFAGQVDIEQNYSIYDRDDQIRLVKEAMKRANLSTDRLSPTKVHSGISRAKNELKTVEAMQAEAGDFYSRNVAKVYEQYEKLLKANNALDFDDLLIKVAYLMRDNPDIRQLLSQRYRYLLIDEYQDTNHAQFLIAHGIAMDHHNICATGDPDQGIYGWRGADINNILDFETHYPGAKVIRMEENYRSTKPIIGAASSLITHNVMRKEKALWTRREGGNNVLVKYCDDEHAEMQMIIRRIQELRKQGKSLEDIAIFYRVNSLSRVVEERLLRAGIPYRIARGVEFYNRKEIKDVLAYLRVLVNPSDDLSCGRIINVPARGIGGTTVGRLDSLAQTRGMSLLDACRCGPEAGLKAAANKKVTAFADMIAELRKSLDQPVEKILNMLVEKTGMERALQGEEGEDSSAWANVSELISAAAEFDKAQDGGTLEEYLQLISLVSDTDHFEGNEGAVSLMTLHAAKGLEFPVVFMIGCEMGLLPFQRPDEAFSMDAAQAAIKQEEERRLAFVGMTRAKEELTMTCANLRMIRGRTTPQAASPFLKELGREFVDVKDGTSQPTQPAMPSRQGGFYADVAERKCIEAMDLDMSYPPEYEHLREGTRVYSQKFGEGKVIKVHRIPWPETRVEVAFRTVGPKKLKLSMANLELMDEF